MSTPVDPLDRLAPPLPFAFDWDDVVRRARPLTVAPARRRRRRWQVALALAGLVFAAIPLVALGRANDWWFFRAPAPQPQSPPVVVRKGTWEGRGWQLVAYPSTTDGLCFALTPDGERLNGEDAALACAPIAGVARTEDTKDSPDMSITYLVGAGSERLPAYVVGPTVGATARVEVELVEGRTLRLATFAAPAPLAAVRFYASPLPPTLRGELLDRGALSLVRRLIGLDEAGAVVACLVPETAVDGISPLSDCR